MSKTMLRAWTACILPLKGEVLGRVLDKFAGTGGAPNAVGPFTYDEADALLRQGAAILGDYCPSMGYWSDLPGWEVRDDYCWLMRKIKPDFSAALQEARREVEEY